MIRGVHTMFYSSQPEALRAFLRDKLGFPPTDVGEGWLIFDLPEADMGCHPADPDRRCPVRHPQHLLLLRRHRADGRRAEGQRGRVHRAGRRPRLRAGDPLQGARATSRCSSTSRATQRIRQEGKDCRTIA